jgi:hypothetical protein
MLALLMCAGAAHANQFIARLSGSQEPEHVVTTAQGTGTFTLTEEGLAYHITVDGLSGPIGAAHFHDGMMGTNGGIVRTIEFNGNTASGIWSPTDAEPLTDDIKTDLLLGHVYVNIHTSEHAAGEIRGQVIVSSGTALRARITPFQVAQHGGHRSTATGTGSFTLVEEGLLYKITINGIPGSVVGEFGLGKPGVQGPPLKTMTFTGNTAEGIWHYDDTPPLTDSLEAELLAGHVYFEIGTGGYYGNEMKGQIYPSEGWGFESSADANQETHSVNSTGKASGAFLLTERGLSYNITASGLTSAITAADLHVGSAGQSGSVIKTIIFNGNSASGAWLKDDAAQPLTADVQAALRRGDVYFEIHTMSYADGEIRGQMMPATGSTFVQAELSSAQEFDPVPSGATGSGVFKVTPQGLEYHITVSGLSGTVSAEFDRGDMGRNGSRVGEISFDGNSADGVWSPDDHQPFTDSRLMDLLTGSLFINISTSQYPGGEIRSQLFVVGGSGLGTDLSTQQEGHPVTSPGAGVGSFTLTPDGLVYQITVNDLSGPIGEAHFHYAATGEDGPIVRTIPFDGNNASGVWRSSDAEPLTDEFVEDLLSGEIYVNIHTSSYAAGEIRGQVFLNSGIGLGAGMDPAQETHPVTSGGTGTVATILTEEALVYTGTVNGLTGPIGETHFHNAAPGTDGPIIKTLEFNGTAISGIWKASDSEPLSVANINALNAGNVYINVHTSQFAAGELRGQMGSTQGASAAGPVPSSRPSSFALAQNYPNPFNPSTVIHFDAAQSGRVRLTVFNLLGQRVATLLDNPVQAGAHEVNFNAAALPSGVYLYSLEAGNTKLVRRMILLK